jgi:uncharacterized protein
MADHIKLFVTNMVAYADTRLKKVGPSHPYHAVIMALNDVFTRNGVCHSHGMSHALDVMRLAAELLDACPEELPDGAHDRVMLAALLHDADDGKYFPNNKNSENARACLAAAQVPDGDVAEVIRMIDLVSASKNGNVAPEGTPDWMLYPRYADRLAAIGWTGVVRCWIYSINQATPRPLYTAATPRPGTEDELWQEATKERFDAYKARGGGSASMLDHYFDKLLIMCREYKDRPNTYLAAESKRRVRVLVEFVLNFNFYKKFDGILLNELLDTTFNDALARCVIEMSS